MNTTRKQSVHNSKTTWNVHRCVHRSWSRSPVSVYRCNTNDTVPDRFFWCGPTNDIAPDRSFLGGPTNDTHRTGFFWGVQQMTPHRTGFGEWFLSFFFNLAETFSPPHTLVVRRGWRRGVPASQSRRSGVQCSCIFKSTHPQDEKWGPDRESYKYAHGDRSRHDLCVISHIMQRTNGSSGNQRTNGLHS